jgi:hypothetical protein
MRHACRSFKTNRLANSLEILTVTAVTIIHCMAQLMHKRIEERNGII